MKAFDNRIEMLDYYLSDNLTGAEIGVFTGEFSKHLISKNPNKLYLVDLFDGVAGSGDVDGNNFHWANLSDVYESLISQYKNSNIEIFKGYSSQFFQTIPNDHLDYIYIDADHSYQGCKLDLENALLKVKNGGYIFGHDYTINTVKAKNHYEFGVRQAVDEICLQYNLTVESIAYDGCTSFCFKNVK